MRLLILTALKLSVGCHPIRITTLVSLVMCYASRCMRCSVPLPENGIRPCSPELGTLERHKKPRAGQAGNDGKDTPAENERSAC